MKTATFYIIEQSTPSDETTSAGLTVIERLACRLAAESWRSGKRILVACDNQQQAEKLDEALWQREPHQFVPHNLAGEGPRQGTPIELCWPGKRSNIARALLINLQSQFADFATAFHEVIDFVPYDETEKQLARERYKTYRNIGFNLTTQPAPTV